MAYKRLVEAQEKLVQFQPRSQQQKEGVKKQLMVHAARGGRALSKNDYGEGSKKRTRLEAPENGQVARAMPKGSTE